MAPVSTLVSPQQLEQALQVFNLASSDLCVAYEELRQQALGLTHALALANGELQRQFDMLQFMRGVHANCAQVTAGDLLREAFETIEPQALARGLLSR